MSKPVRYDLIDRQTGRVIATYQSRVKATRRADRLDLAHGAIRYQVKPIWPTPAGWDFVTA